MGAAAVHDPASVIGSRRLAYILRSYPRLSQTFVLQELLSMEQLGFDLEVFALAHAREPMVQDQVQRVRAHVRYLTPAARRRVVADHAWAALAHPIRYSATAAYVLRRRDLDRGYRTASRMTCFNHALHIARVLRRSRAPGEVPIRHLHSHFAHDPTLVAMLVGRIAGVTFSFTAHARDLYQLPRRSLAERIHAATAAITCCDANLGYLQHVASAADVHKLQLVRHGVDVSAFQPALSRSPASRRPVVVSGGRMVEKKGFLDLLRACRLVMDRGVDFTCRIYGDGPLRGELARMIEALGLAGHVTLPGVRTQRELVEEIRRADLFVLTPIVTEDGDRDGIPNVILEAMACGVAVVATDVGGVAEAVVDGQTGLLVPAGDEHAVADAMIALLTDDHRRASAGAAARRSVMAGFDSRTSARRLAHVLTTTGGLG